MRLNEIHHRPVDKVENKKLVNSRLGIDMNIFRESNASLISVFVENIDFEIFMQKQIMYPKVQYCKHSNMPLIRALDIIFQQN